MDAELLFEKLETFHPVSTGLREALLQELKAIDLPRNHMVQEGFEVATNLFFILEGFAMAFHYHEGRRITRTFWKRGDFMSSFESFINQKPSDLYIQMMEAGTLMAISYQGLARLLAQYPEAEAIYRCILNEKYIESTRFISEVQRSGPEQRLKSLRLRYPGIEGIVPQDAIATYLGITPQSLSRMRRRMYRR